MTFFNFGKNWKNYSLRALTDQRLDVVKDSVKDILGIESLKGKTFLDVGCGSGIFSIAAAQLGAEVKGVDINPLCIEVSIHNAQEYTPDDQMIPEFATCNALDENQMRQLGQFDVVYAWGSLHHTGDMYRAIELTAERVAPGGTFMLAIYNKHSTSPTWKAIKWVYNSVPGLLQRLMALIGGAAIFVAKALVTRQNPLKKERGMSFWYDVIDWMGGYPYEYASTQEIESFVAGLGFTSQRTVPATTPTGCNEFVFLKNAPATH